MEPPNSMYSISLMIYLNQRKRKVATCPSFEKLIPASKIILAPHFPIILIR